MTPGQREIFRFVVNGLFATAVHYIVLNVNMTVLEFRSAGLANFLAALVGIASSFLGSYFYVFRSKQGRILHQFAQFGGLYSVMAVLHGFVLWLWSDYLSFDYRIGFVTATALQVCLSYLGNKYIVFR
jgi:putative flippase GtrA